MVPNVSGKSFSKVEGTRKEKVRVDRGPTVKNEIRSCVSYLSNKLNRLTVNVIRFITRDLSTDDGVGTSYTDTV